MSLYPALPVIMKNAGTFNPRWVKRHISPRVTDEGQEIHFSIRCDNAIPGARAQLAMTGGGSLGGSGNWTKNWTAYLREVLEPAGITVRPDTSSTVPALFGTVSWTLTATDTYVPGTELDIYNTVRRNRKNNAPNYGDIRGGAGSFQILMRTITQPTPEGGLTAAQAYGTGAVTGGAFYDVRDTSRKPLGYPTIKFNSLAEDGTTAVNNLTEGDTFLFVIQTAFMIPNTQIKLYVANLGQNELNPSFRTALKEACENKGVICKLPQYTPETAKEWFNGGFITFTETYSDDNPIVVPLTVEIDTDDEPAVFLDIVGSITREGDADEYEKIVNRGDYDANATYLYGDYVTLTATGRKFLVTDPSVKGVSPPTDEDTVENGSWREFLPIQSLGMSLSKQLKDRPEVFWEISTINGVTGPLTKPDGSQTRGNKYSLGFPTSLDYESYVWLYSENTPAGFREALEGQMPADRIVPAEYELREVATTWDDPDWERVAATYDQDGVKYTLSITPEELVQQGYTRNLTGTGLMTQWGPEWTSAVIPNRRINGQNYSSVEQTKEQLAASGYQPSATRRVQLVTETAEYTDVRVYSGKALKNVTYTKNQIVQDGQTAPATRLTQFNPNATEGEDAGREPDLIRIYSGRQLKNLELTAAQIKATGYGNAYYWYQNQIIYPRDYYFVNSQKVYYKESPVEYRAYWNKPVTQGTSIYAWFQRNFVEIQDFYYNGSGQKTNYTEYDFGRVDIFGDKNVQGTVQETSAFSWYLEQTINKGATYYDGDSNKYVAFPYQTPNMKFYGPVDYSGRQESSLAYGWYKQNFIDPGRTYVDASDSYRVKTHGKPIAWKFYKMAMVKVKEEYIQKGPLTLMQVDQINDNGVVKDRYLIRNNITAENFVRDYKKLFDKYIFFEVYDVPQNWGAHRLRLLLGPNGSYISIPDAVCYDPPPYVNRPTNAYGWNAAGGEFGSAFGPTGEYTVYNGGRYYYPSKPELADPALRHRSMDYYWRKGCRVMRLPFKWERIQHKLFGPLYYGDDVPFTTYSAQDMRRIIEIVDYWTAKGGYTLLDLHNYMGYAVEPARDPNTGAVLLSKDGKEAKSISGKVKLDSPLGITPAALIDVWLRLDEVFGSNHKVWYGIMNEPSGDGASPVRTAANMQAVVSALRARRDSTNLCTIGGSGYSNCKRWVADGVAAAFDTFYDPMNNFAFEPHNYIDEDQSGTKGVCVTQTVTSNQLVAFTNWCRSKGFRGLLGEVAGGNPKIVGNEQCALSVPALYQYMYQNPDVWLGWTTWSAGFPASYYFNLEPPSNNYEGDLNSPCMDMLIPFLEQALADGRPNE